MKDSKSIYIALYALLMIVVLYVISYTIRYFRYVREKDQETTNDMDLNQNYRYISVVHKRCEDHGESRWKVTRTIESKVPKLKSIKHRHGIFGQSSIPVVESATHDISYTILPTDPNGWNPILIKFKKPLWKGEIAEFSVEIKGTDCPNFHFCRVNTPIDLLVFDITLMNKLSAPHAELIMIPIDGKIVNVINKKEVVRFNRKEKRYYIKIEKPQVGYTYQLNWGEELKKVKRKR